jgi:hypothetical protein
LNRQAIEFNRFPDDITLSGLDWHYGSLPR